VKKNISIRLLDKEEQLPFDLLLLADPSEDMISLYLSDSDVFIAEADQDILGICVVYPESQWLAEIKNIAVKEEYQGRGIGRLLLNHVISTAKARGFKELIIGTADCGLMQIRLYQSVGFEISGIKENFFTDNYPEPLYENGILIKDMVILSKTLQTA
jgi:ribosomal protein S18 acetylase RimI-like enzyme